MLHEVRQLDMGFTYDMYKFEMTHKGHDTFTKLVLKFSLYTLIYTELWDEDSHV